MKFDGSIAVGENVGLDWNAAFVVQIKTKKGRKGTGMRASVGVECRQAGKRAGKAIYIADSTVFSTGHSRRKGKHGMAHCV